MQSYLTNRKQYVDMDDVQSEMLMVTTSVPKDTYLFLYFLTEIRDFCYKYGLSGEERLLALFSCESDQAVSTQVLGIFYAQVIQSNTAGCALISKGF